MSTKGKKFWTEFEVNDQRFWIQNVEKCHVDIVVHAMVNDYVREEPIGLYSKSYEDHGYKLESEVAYQNIVENGCSLVCLTVNEDGQPTVAAMHCLEIVNYEEVKDEYMFGHSYLWHLLQFNNICAKMNVKKYIIDKGMYVFPEFRRNGISVQLLKCWPLLCKRLKIQICMGTFTSEFSQLAARRAGLVELKWLSYEEMRKVFPEQIPLGIEEHSKGVALYYACA
ncbi:hypothetical protein FQR65_LT03762 [Abscondita terminalis]|nr:hypothetical protein FQR65_LT03762 [Abscondita terminalis]